MNTKKTFNVTLTWTGASELTVVNVNVEGDNPEWLTVLASLPQRAVKAPSELEGIVQIPLKLTVPPDAQPRGYSVTVTVTSRYGIREYITPVRISYEVRPQPVAGIPDWMTYALLIAILTLHIQHNNRATTIPKLLFFLRHTRHHGPDKNRF